MNGSKCLRKAYELPLQCGEGGYLSSSLVESLQPILTLDKIPVPGTDCYLSHREYECLQWIAHGKSQQQIAEILEITPRTVKAHFANLRQKLNCYNQFQLGMVFADLQQCADLFNR